MPTIATPTVLTDAGYLFIAPLATAVPTNTVAGSVFTDAWSASWIPLGATEEGSTLSYSITVEPVPVAELFDPVKYATTERNGSIAFNLADFTLSNYRRALNGGTAALAPTSGTGATVVSIPADSVVHVEGHVGVYAGGTGDANDDFHIVTGTEVRALSAVGPTGANVTALTHTDSGDSFAVDLTWEDSPGSITVTATGDTGALLAGYLEVRIYALDCTVAAG
jgi:hypothetical protein